MQANGERLWAELMAMAELGATENGGSERLALTERDKAARDLFAAWCLELKLDVHVDEIGSMFARRAGRNPDLPPIMVGSHLDTQPRGGRFDGVYGVLAAIEALRTIEEAGHGLQHPVEIVNWTNEEGSRFAPATMGSGVFAGAWSLSEALSRTDRNGISVADALKAIDYVGTLKAKKRPIHAYLEAHIEQGPVLEARGIPIGAVTGARGQIWYRLTITGTEAHAGAAAMDLRRDALAAAAEVILAVETLAKGEHPDAVGTVGSISATPNSPNVVPGRVDLTVEFRAFEKDTLLRLDQGLKAWLKGTREQRGVAIDLEVSMRSDPVAFDAKLVAAIEQSAADAGHEVMRMPSGAGHDACRIAAIAPAAMIFIPCVGGISHNEAEDITVDWAEAGASVLAGAILAADATGF
ncbi:MAG TPA: Zn-dependent hydrolase [Devosiaceae bacterium]